MAELPRCGAAGGGEEGGSAGPANKLTDSGIHVGAPDTRQTGPGPPCADRLHICDVHHLEFYFSYGKPRK